MHGRINSVFFLEYATAWDFEHNTIFVFKNGEQYAVE